MERPTSKIASPLSKVTRRIVYRIIYWLLAPFGLFFCKFILRVKIVNKSSIKNLKRSKAILVSNHCLYIDPLLVLYAIYPHKSLFTTTTLNTQRKFVGGFIRTMGAINLPNRRSMWNIHNITQHLNQSQFIHFFPEGKLAHYNQQLQKFHKGAFYIACKHQLPIICLSNKVRRRRLFGKKVRFLPPQITCYISDVSPPPPDIQHKKINAVVTEWAKHTKESMQQRLH